MLHSAIAKKKRENTKPKIDFQIHPIGVIYNKKATLIKKKTKKTTKKRQYFRRLSDEELLQFLQELQGVQQFPV